MNKLKGFIGVAFHKKSFLYSDDRIIPLLVGALSNRKKIEKEKIELKYAEDSMRENISKKNSNYCELTGIYWMLKNIDADYYGLMHYRRYLTLEEKNIYKIKRYVYAMNKKINLKLVAKILNIGELFQIKINNENTIKKKIKKFSDEIEENIKKYDVILPKKEIFRKNVYEHYKEVHIAEHLEKLLSIIKEEDKDIYIYYEKNIIKNNKIYPLNMFVMKKEYFNEYFEFIFKILFKLEKEIVIPNDDYQKRVFGFLSERMMLPYVEYLKDKKNIKIKECTVLYYES